MNENRFNPSTPEKDQAREQIPRGGRVARSGAPFESESISPGGSGLGEKRRAAGRRTPAGNEGPSEDPEQRGASGLGLSSSAEEGLMAIGQALEEQLRERPYVTLAAAAGVGVLVGQAFASRVGRMALLAAGGYAAMRVLQADGLKQLADMLSTDIDDEDPDLDFDAGE